MLRIGTLVASKRINFHSEFKNKLEEIGFDNVTMTSAEKDELYMKIREVKPKNLFIGSSYYECCTPHLIAGIHKLFPKVKIAAISITTDYPEALVRDFIDNGICSYVNYWEGKNEFYKALEIIRKGGTYIPKHIEEKRNKFDGDLVTQDYLTERQVQILRLLVNGYEGNEIMNRLGICTSTLNAMKKVIYKALGARNAVEAVTRALKQKIINLDEIRFYPEGFEFKTCQKNENRRIYGFTSKKRRVQDW